LDCHIACKLGESYLHTVDCNNNSQIIQNFLQANEQYAYISLENGTILDEQRRTKWLELLKGVSPNHSLRISFLYQGLPSNIYCQKDDKGKPTAHKFWVENNHINFVIDKENPGLKELLNVRGLEVCINKKKVREVNLHASQLKTAQEWIKEYCTQKQILLEENLASLQSVPSPHSTVETGSICSICSKKSDTKQIVCTSCYASYHLKCLKLTSPPPKFICNECTVDRSQKQKRKRDNPMDIMDIDVINT